MYKIKNLFKGVSLVVVLASLVIAGVASAALVNYLSDNVTATATLVSPVGMSVNSGANSEWTGSKSINVNTTGGSDFTFTTVAKNNANNIISGYPVIVAKAPAGKNFTGGEIDKVKFGDASYWPETSMIDITVKMYVVYADGTLYALSSWTGDSDTLVLFFDNDGNGTAQTYPIPANTENWNVLTVTTDQAIAPGTYTVSAQYVNDLAKFAAEEYAK